jgi:Leucine-rich repeat (LRR) protein
MSGEATLIRKESCRRGSNQSQQDLERKLSIRNELQSIQRSISQYSQQGKSTNSFDAHDAILLSSEANLIRKESFKSTDQLDNKQKDALAPKRGQSIREGVQLSARSFQSTSSSVRDASVASDGEHEFCLNNTSVEGQWRTFGPLDQDIFYSDSTSAITLSSSTIAAHNDTSDQTLPKSLRGLRPGDARPGAYEFYRVRPRQASHATSSAQLEPTEDAYTDPEDNHQALENDGRISESLAEDNVIASHAHTDREDHHQAFDDGGRKNYFLSHWNRRKKLILVSLFVIIITVVVAVAVTFTNQPTRDSDPCSLKGPQTQCGCFGTVKVVSEATKRQYSLLQTSIKNFPQESNYIYSCDPRNVALLLVASMDTAAKSTEQMLMERYVLNLLYLSWNGPKWTLNKGWLGGEEVCAWSGVSCNGGKSVTRLDLPRRGLKGTFVCEIGFLSSLIAIDFQRNSLSGDLCTDIGLLTQLTQLDLGINDIGSGFGIPSEIGNLEKLQVLQLNDNSFVGRLPSELSRLTNLLNFTAENNFINNQGPLPLWNSSLLTFLSVGNCGITGSIPSQIGLMTGLTYLRLFKNLLTNTIPSEIGLLTNLKYLNLRTNAITGTIPSTIAHFRKLCALDFHENELTGIVPSEAGLMTSLTVLDIAWNQLSGTIPLEVTKCSLLQQFIVHDNRLTGTLPDEAFGRLTNLETVKLQGNFLLGSPSSDSTTGLCNLRNVNLTTLITTPCSGASNTCSCCTPC